MFKIQSGKYKQQGIYKPKSARVLQSKLRQHLFNYLGDFINQAFVLDLFAGAGTFGIEALSHGANKVYFIEKNSGAVYKIRKNLEKLGLNDQGVIIKSDVVNYLNNLIKNNKKYAKGKLLFDVIFMDPPYKTLLAKTVEHQERYIRQLLYKAYQVLNTHGVIILKIHKRIPVTLMNNMALLEKVDIGINSLYYLVQPNYINAQLDKKLQENIKYGNNNFLKVGGRQEKKIKKGIKKKSKLHESDLYEIARNF